MSKKENIITIVLFFGFILGFLIAFIVKPDIKFSDNENRYLEQQPKASFADVKSGEFMEGWEDYVSDQFPLRDSFMMVGARCKNYIGIKDINGVFLGADGHLLSVMDKNAINHERVVKNIDIINSFLNKVDADAAFMLVPDAVLMYENKLPKGVDIKWERKLLMDIRAGISDATLIVPENEMLKTDEQLYYYTDHHWTGYGAQAAYKEYCNQLGITEKEAALSVVSEEFYGSLYSKVLFCEKADEIVLDESKKDIKIVKDGENGYLYDYDILNKKDKYLLFQGGNYGLVEIEGTGEGTLLVLKDSFANSFVPFLTENYEKIVMVDLRYYMGSVTALCEKEGVTNVLVLYSLSNFVSDENMIKLGL